MANCRIHEEYPRHIFIPCQNPAMPGDSKGFCILHSQDQGKDLIGFQAALRARWQQEDSKYYDFRWVYFPFPFDPQHFFGTREFNKPIDCSNATFMQVVAFPGAIFNASVSFSGTTFKQMAIFDNAKFINGANFSGATFVDTSSFFLATFNEEVHFSHTNFDGPLVLGMTQIDGQVLFQSINQSGKVFDGYFGDLTLGSNAVLGFQNLSLAQVRFGGTYLRRVEFDHVTWASCWWRAGVYNELLLHQQRWAHITYVLNYGWLWGKRVPGEIEKDIPKKPTFEDFAPVERLYRQLKANYEDQRDLKRVGDFHYGEMEMHRRGSFWRQWVPFSWHNLYRALSGYGERPLRAFIWLLLLIPAWAGLVWGLGIDQAASPNPVSYGDALLFIFEKATLQRPPWTDIANINWLGKLLASLSVLLLPGQAALFILALRNRLGRRR